MAKQDDIGKRFGRLVVTSPATPSNIGKRRVEVRCDCGIEKIVLAGNLRSGLQVSCGCAKRKPKSESHIKNLRTIVRFNWCGGQTGADFAALLCPLGYIREYRIQWGQKGDGRGRHFCLDFAHLESKTNIELDGPGHRGSVDWDNLRDSILRSLGWRVIRIKHD